ncbi:MAG: diacylglycerol kinase [Clostridia bacterium]|jgi:diacylglycerol kinase (ATP)|nr:diacylglycerol kinase [Clostridia bacterium]
MKSKSFLDSFNHALEGVISAFQTERNLKLHFLLAIASLILALFYDFSKVEFLILLFTITFVICMELVNTAIEYVVDLVCEERCGLNAKRAKDIAAGAVFISAINALCVAYLLFYSKIDIEGYYLINTVKNAPMHLTFIALFLITIITVVLKALLGYKTPFHGGFPSGHSALAFSLAMVISFVTKDFFAISIAFFLALLVAQSRIEGKIHNIIEVIAGSILGILITTIIFQFFS